MRSSAATNFGLLLSVVVLTKSTIACFAGPSFQEDNGSAATVAAGWPVVGAGVGLLVQPTSVRIKKNDKRNDRRDFILSSPGVAEAWFTTLTHYIRKGRRHMLPPSSYLYQNGFAAGVPYLLSVGRCGAFHHN